MGQAKNRGTFEQHKAEAIERNRRSRTKHSGRNMPRPQGKSRVGALMALALGFGAWKW